jgi:putative ABC transport system substrate-binding protein
MNRLSRLSLADRIGLDLQRRGNAMRRREMIGLIGGGLLWPVAARSQRTKTIPLLGYLSGASADAPANRVFFKGLRDLGYFEGENIRIDARYASGRLDLLPGMAAEMVSQKPNVLIGSSAVPSLALQRETSSIPIVAIAIHDGVRMGLYKSLARPGGNITGLDTLSEEVDQKRVAMLKEIVPGLSRLTLFYNPNDPGLPAHLENSRALLTKLGIAIQVVEVRSMDEFDGAFARMQKDPPQAILVFLDQLFFVARQRIVDFGFANRIPMNGEDERFVRLGQLISYGASLEAIWYRAAYFADRILKGVPPEELPVEQPTELRLVVNLKTAKAFGLQLPEEILVTANEVVE